MRIENFIVGAVTTHAIKEPSGQVGFHMTCYGGQAVLPGPPSGTSCGPEVHPRSHLAF